MKYYPTRSRSGSSGASVETQRQHTDRIQHLQSQTDELRAVFNNIGVGVKFFVDANPSDVDIHAIDATGAVRIGAGGTSGVAAGAASVGFCGNDPVKKITVTGSRGSNAALASLLTALANYGLITDSTS